MSVFSLVGDWLREPSVGITYHCNQTTPHHMLSSHPKRGHNPNLIGIVAMVLAAAMFTLVDVMLKLLVAHYPPWQVVGMRGLVSLPVLAWWIHRRGAWSTLIRIRVPLQLFRGLLAVGMLLFLTMGFRDLPLANAYTLYFIAPLLMTLMSAPVLGERVTAVHWWAVVGGLCGVIIAMRPGAEGFVNWAAVFIVGAALCYAGMAVLTRLGSRTDSNESLMFWMALMTALVPTVWSFSDWVPVQTSHWVWLAVLAVAGFFAHWAITEAFRHGRASVVAPFEYTALAWAVAVDWLIWSKLPEAHIWLGGAVILLSGLYVLRHEMRAQAPIAVS